MLLPNCKTVDQSEQMVKHFFLIIYTTESLTVNGLNTQDYWLQARLRPFHREGWPKNQRMNKNESFYFTITLIGLYAKCVSPDLI